jgi:hypothetical protein
MSPGRDESMSSSNEKLPADANADDEIADLEVGEDDAERAEGGRAVKAGELGFETWLRS